MKILDLGCGSGKYKGDSKDVIIGLDKNLGSADIISDLELPLPFKDNIFDFVYIHHVLEHIKNLLPLMDEIWRVTRKDGQVYIETPYFASSKAVTDPTHVRFFAYGSFDHHYGQSYRYIKGKFKVLKKKIMFSSHPKLKLLDKIFTPLINMSSSTTHFYNRFLCYILPCEDIEFLLKVVK